MGRFFKPMLVLLLIPGLGYSKPFWTEKSSYAEGDRVYFVGVATKQKNVETGRKVALENARQELSNYLQLSSTEGITFNTKRTFEERGGLSNVYRLMWVSREDITAFKQKKMKTEQKAAKKEIATLDKEIKKREKLIQEVVQQQKTIKDQNTRLATIQRRISTMTIKAKKNLKCGMTVKEAIAVSGKPQVKKSSGDDMFLNYGQYWAVFDSGILKCVQSIKEYNGVACYSSHKCPEEL